MDGQKYSYPVALVNGRVEVTEETFKDGVVREYLDKEFDLWLKQAPNDYEEMYYGDEDVMSKSGAIEGAMEIVISTIEEEAPKKMTFNFDEGDVEFYEAYQYAKGGEVGDGDGVGSLKVNKESDGKYYWTFTFSNGKIEKSFQDFNTSADAQRDFQYRSKYFAKGGEVEDKNQYDFSIRIYKDNLDILNDNPDYEHFRGTKEDVLKKVNDSLKKEEILYAYVWIENIVTDWYHESGDLERMRMELNRYGENEYAKGGKIGFEGLAKKVAKRYVGRKVSKEYQAEYGKTYDAKEAQEVGNKVAGKVYQQQVAKKKIVRKLQRKTN